MRAALVIVLVLAAGRAEAPAPAWRLVPAEWDEGYLCLRPCPLKHGWVKSYKWEAT